MATIERKKFHDIFDELPDGALRPKIQIEVGGTSFGPGVLFQKGVIFGGIDFHLYKYYDVAIELQEDGTSRILGFYKES